VGGTPSASEAAGDHHDLVQRRVRLLDEPREPPHGEPLASLAVPERDKGCELERLAQVERCNLLVAATTAREGR